MDYKKLKTRFKTGDVVVYLGHNITHPDYDQSLEVGKKYVVDTAGHSVGKNGAVELITVTALPEHDANMAGTLTRAREGFMLNKHEFKLILRRVSENA